MSLAFMEGTFTGTPSGVPGMGPFFFKVFPLQIFRVGLWTNEKAPFRSHDHFLANSIALFLFNISDYGPRCGNTKWCSRYGALLWEEAPLRDEQKCSRECPLLDWRGHSREHHLVIPVWGSKKLGNILAPSIGGRPRYGMTKWCSRECPLLDWRGHPREHQVVFPVWGLTLGRGPVTG